MRPSETPKRRERHIPGHRALQLSVKKKKNPTPNRLAPFRKIGKISGSATSFGDGALGSTRPSDRIGRLVIGAAPSVSTRLIFRLGQTVLGAEHSASPD